MSNFKQWLESSVPALTSEQFPLFKKSLSIPGKEVGDPARIERFEQMLDTLNSYTNQEGIPNPRYGELKDYFNHRFENVFDGLLGQYFYGGKSQSLPTEWQNFYYDLKPSIQTLNGRLNKAEKLPECVVKQPVLEMYRELKPIADAMTLLKTKIVKRVVGQAQEVKKQYIAGLMTHEAIKKVHDLLIQVTQQLHEVYLAAIVGRYTKYVESFIPEFEKNPEYRTNPDTYGLMKKFFRDAEAMDVVGRLMTRQEYNKPMHLDPDWQNKIKKSAEQIAKDVQERFVSKNTEKLASIISKKDNMKDAVIINSFARWDGITGTLKLTFADGSLFIVDNTVVLSRSIYGKEFYRFPTTFHNVMMPDGKPMGRPSEERMNSVFVTGKEGNA